MVALVWRATFIDVDDAVDLKAKVRSQSTPCRRSLVPTDVFDGERRYVAELRAKFCARAAEATPFCCGATAPSDVIGVPAAGESSACNNNHIVSSMLLGAKLGDPHCAMLDSETREPSSLMSNSPHGSITPFADHGMTTMPGCNTGSIGHPSLCARPCLYFAAGQCANGTSCEYCHMDHPKRSPHLNKKHRDQLRDMPPAAAKALIVPIVREKTMELDASEYSVSACARLARACGVPATPPSRLSRGDRSLSVALRGMSLRLLLITLQRSLLHGEPEAGEAVDALLAHLRGVA